MPGDISFDSSVLVRLRMAPRAAVSTLASRAVGSTLDEVVEPPLQADTPAASSATDASEQKDRFMSQVSVVVGGCMATDRLSLDVILHATL
ncbi:hypothetical protein RugamoR1_36560 [Rugamonas sp. R1(2021)]